MVRVGLSYNFLRMILWIPSNVFPFSDLVICTYLSSTQKEHAVILKVLSSRNVAIKVRLFEILSDLCAFWFLFPPREHEWPANTITGRCHGHKAFLLSARKQGKNEKMMFPDATLFTAAAQRLQKKKNTTGLNGFWWFYAPSQL